MPDDAIERARECLADVVGESAAWTAKNIRNNTDAGGALPVATADALRAMIAFASQQAPDGWRPIDEAKPGQIGTFWIASIDADEGGWYKFGSVAKADPLLCILDDDDRGYWPHENGGYATHFQPVLAPPAMLDAAPSVTLGEVG